MQFDAGPGLDRQGDPTVRGLQLQLGLPILVRHFPGPIREEPVQAGPADGGAGERQEIVLDYPAAPCSRRDRALVPDPDAAVSIMLGGCLPPRGAAPLVIQQFALRPIQPQETGQRASSGLTHRW